MKLTNKAKFEELEFAKFRLTGLSFSSEFCKYSYMTMKVYLQVFSRNFPEQGWYQVTEVIELNTVKRYKSSPCNYRTDI